MAFQFLKRVLADGAFNTAGFLFSSFLIDVGGDKLLGEEWMTLC